MSLQEAKMVSLKDKIYGQPVKKVKAKVEEVRSKIIRSKRKRK